MNKHTRQKGELGFHIALALLFLVCLTASFKLLISAPKLSGEGTVPTLCALVMLATTLLSLLELRRGPRPFEDALPPVKKLKETFAYLFPGKVGAIVVFCVLYAVALHFIGFAVSTFLFLLLSMLTLHREKKLRTMVISGVTTLCVLIVFQYVFQVQLP